ncbi:MAG: prolyl oligopeptidase family serine peptidase [Candidatus Eisenbacteria bacterium]|nr:prolyl oligopeptidase family serine peptidase [Candidatus Eisenbacteria bacterium]
MRARPMTPEDLWKLPRVGAPEPSPDGDSVIVPVTRYSLEENSGRTRLYLVPAAAREAGQGAPDDAARPLTSHDTSSTQPAWSPNGDHVLFVRKPGGNKKDSKDDPGPNHPDQAQLYILPLQGGEAERLTDLPLGVAAPRWFPDGRRIAFLGFVYADAAALDAAAERSQKLEKDPVKARTSEDRVYRFWDQWLTDGKVPHIFVLDLESREIIDLIPSSRRWFDWMDLTDQFSIAPDGGEIAFAACRTQPPHDPALWGVFTVKVPAKIRPGAKVPRPVCLTPRHPADTTRPVYSPDGQWIIFGMQREFDFYADRVRLVAHNRRSRRQTVLTEDWDRSAMGWVFGKDPNVLYLAAEVEARTAFFSLDLHRAIKKPGSVQPLELTRGGTFTGPRPAGERMFTAASSLTEPPEVVSFDRDGSGRAFLTAFTRPVLKELALGSVEEISFIGAEDDLVQMFLVHPPAQSRRKESAKPGQHKRLPLVHMIHGGPHGAFGDVWHWRWNAQAFAAPGFLVALVNFHGSTGWGQDFTASILGRWGDQPYIDIMAATDNLVDRGLADPKRMAAAGGSYGGYLVSWIAAQTDRFACLVNHAGVCDFQTQYASDITQGRRRSMGGEPWDDLEGMDRYNPIRQARGFRSPMLVVHGERDYRVPYAQGIEIYNVYKARKLPARLVVYPDENHWILKPRNSLHWYGEVLGWLDRWLCKRRKSKKR